MKKRLFNIPLVYLLSLLLLALIGILVGTFNDYAISSAIADIKAPFGMFIETFGMTLGYCMVPCGGAMLFKGLYKNKNRFLQIIGYLFLIASFGLGTYYIGDGSHYRTKFDLPVPLWAGYLFGALICALVIFLILFFIDSRDKRKLICIGLVIILSMVLQYLTIELMKHLASRPRYRYLSDNELNTVGDVFRNWYEFAPFTAQNDHFKSWPSGHTGTASVFLLLPLIVPYFRYQKKFLLPLSYILSFASVLMVMYGRIRCGAHFLSDVSFGLFFAVLAYIFILSLGQYFFKKATSNEMAN